MAIGVSNSMVYGTQAPGSPYYGYTQGADGLWYPPAGGGEPQPASPSPAQVQEIVERYRRREITRPQAEAELRSLYPSWSPTQFAHLLDPVDVTRSTTGGGATPGTLEEQTSLDPIYRRHLLQSGYQRYNPLLQSEMEQEGASEKERYWLSKAATGPTGQDPTFSAYLEALRQGTPLAGGMQGLRNVQDILRRTQEGTEVFGPETAPISERYSQVNAQGLPVALLNAIETQARSGVAPAARQYLMPYLLRKAQDYFAQGGPESTRTPYSFTQALANWF